MGGRSSEALAVTASTGIASVNIGGTTVHSWAGIGLAEGSPKEIAQKIVYSGVMEKVRDRWRTVETLIIDESM